MTATSRANALRQVNLMRWIADLPAVETTAEHNAADQQCALMMDAENDLSHEPGTSWACYSASGAEAAGMSCIAGEGAVSAAMGYMVDPGNETTLGHRRWILSNWLGPIGIGSTGKASCMYTGTEGNAGKQWTAWPPPGSFPIEATRDAWDRSMDDTGWSIQSDSINLSSATVTIKLDGNVLPVTVAKLLGGYGSDDAISIIPKGWKIAAGKTYEVSVSGISTPISYSVSVVSCE